MMTRLDLWQKLELLGFVLLSVSTAFGLFFLGTVEDIGTGVSHHHQTNRKLDILWDLHEEDAEVGNLSADRLDKMDGRYRETMDYEKRVWEQERIFREINTGVFAIGATVMASSKYLKWSSKD